jgi:hypothetical protein
MTVAAPGAGLARTLAPYARRDRDPVARTRSGASVSDLGPDDRTSTITIAIVGESQATRFTARVVACLAELAATDELIVVYGSDQPGTNPVVAALRARLPRFKVVPLYVAPLGGPCRCDAAVVDGLLDDGSLPVILAPAVTAPTVAAELYHHLRADRMLEVSLV